MGLSRPRGKFFEVGKGTTGVKIILAFFADVLGVSSRVPSQGLRDEPKERLRWRLLLFEINYPKTHFKLSILSSVFCKN